MLGSRFSPYPIFGLGLYKFIAMEKVNGQYRYKDHFYIDYRTSAIPEDCPAGCDYVIDFSVSSGIFKYVGSSIAFPEEVAIWDLVNISLEKTELEPLPPKDLVQTAPMVVRY